MRKKGEKKAEDNHVEDDSKKKKARPDALLTRGDQLRASRRELNFPVRVLFKKR